MAVVVQLSDTHLGVGPDHADHWRRLERCLTALAPLGAAAILLTGDLVDD